MKSLDEETDISDEAKKIEKAKKKQVQKQADAKAAKEKKKAKEEERREKNPPKKKARKEGKKKNQGRKKSVAQDGHEEMDAGQDGQEETEKETREQSAATKEKRENEQIYPRRTIPIGSLSKITRGPEFYAHVLLCIEKVLEDRNLARLQGTEFLSDFLSEYEPEEYSSLSLLIENLEKFAKARFGEKHARSEAMDTLVVKMKKSGSSGPDANASDKKRKRQDGMVEDVEATLRDIVIRVCFKPVSMFVSICFNVRTL